ncbi:MAG: ATP-binding protein, partial [Comamonadaceae bacterium]|nr:ATP-binding protein [Comamonadaceae bacterium]
QDPSHRYVQRMQQAVRVLYGTASPSEAFSAAPLQLEPLDLNAFLALVAGNAPHAGIADVTYEGTATPMWVGADEHSLEDVVTHVLRNADRYRTPGTPVKIQLRTDGALAVVSIANQGPPIDVALIDRIFEYGVSDPNASQNGEQRGQGLYVARTYMAKMGGTIVALNTADGVCFELRLPLRVSALAA